ncbi:hypothetical protein RHSIM_Rhsim11G0008800 [Rhododendron simsii]|uniref:Casein kinase II subunit beta n=1 Tax=Rhododendron simsii TaxID=118357 RepID=A0A834G7D1_RHOSS|nr:hypothetical protein RHSIM_Rhsim11G0008800 [Rhododendron simsii]
MADENWLVAEKAVRVPKRTDFNWKFRRGSPVTVDGRRGSPETGQGDEVLGLGFPVVNLINWNYVGDTFTEEQNELVESAAEMLYGLIHVRYILTSKGMAAMLEKYKNAEFGRCPRVYCSGQPCLPFGQSDIPRQSTVKIYCPKCEDIYSPRSRYQNSILA